MTSSSFGVIPPPPNNNEKNISVLFDEVKNICLQSSSFDTYPINGSNYTYVMNSIIGDIIKASTNKDKNEKKKN